MQQEGITEGNKIFQNKQKTTGKIRKKLIEMFNKKKVDGGVLGNRGLSIILD